MRYVNIAGLENLIVGDPIMVLERRRESENCCLRVTPLFVSLVGILRRNEITRGLS
jgi:hypothetical protein